MTVREGEIHEWTDAYLVRKLRASQAQVKGGWCEPKLDKRLRALVPKLRGEMRRRGLKLSSYPAYGINLGQPWWPIKSEPRPAPPAEHIPPVDVFDDLEALLEASLREVNA